MKTRSFTTLLVLLLPGLVWAAANSSGWAGEYRDDKFLGGRAVFQMTIDHRAARST
jgi:hypothetical protein